MKKDKDGVKWYTRKELMELLKTAERVPMRNFNPYNIREMKEAISQYCDGRHCDDCLMSLKCPRGREEPWIDNCKDWDKEEIVEAYRCIEGEI